MRLVLLLACLVLQGALGASDEELLQVERWVAEYPEISWLADGDVRKTEEGSPTEGSYSEQFFGQKYIEFDRTLMTLRCLDLILEGSDRAYEDFTAAQPSDVRLSKESFAYLHSQGRHLIQSSWSGLSELEMRKALESALVLGDIGKSGKAREFFRPYEIAAPDHDDFYGEAMQVLKQHPEICPTFQKLPPETRELLQKTASLAHFGHITQLEGGPSMFRQLKKSGIAASDPIALDFDLFIYTCDTAGALGHVNPKSSLVYHEWVYRAIRAMGESVRLLSSPNVSELDCYKAYAAIRGSWLGLSEEEKVQAKIGAMLRLYTPEEGKILQRGFQQLNESVLERVLFQFDVEKEKIETRTPTYLPAVLVNLSNHRELGETKEERLTRTLILGLFFMTRVLEEHQRLLQQGQIDPSIPLNFNTVAADVKKDPRSLLRKFMIDNEGMVLLKEVSNED